MAITIIQRGELPEEKEYQAQCHKCKSVLSWKKKDARIDFPGDQRDGPFTQINCPVCGGNVTGY